MKIINIVNSFIGKKGNIGLRTSYIISELNSQKIKNFSYSRGVVKHFEKNNKNMRIFGQIPRILNAFRIYINLWFNHRKYDIWFFEKFFFLSYKKSNCENKIAHVWETSPKIIKKLKTDGFKVVLDLPIAPTATAKGLIGTKGSIVRRCWVHVTIGKYLIKTLDYQLAVSFKRFDYYFRFKITRV